MAGSVGNIETDIIKSGLVFNMDAANRASYPKTGTIWNNTINNITGSIDNSPTFSTNNSGFFTFDQVGDKVNYPSLLSLDALRTVSVWVKTPSSPAGTVISEGGKILIGMSSTQFWIFKYNTNNSLYSTGNLSYGAYNVSVTSNTWYNLTAVMYGTGNNDFYLYVNGQPVTLSYSSTVMGNYTNEGSWMAVNGKSGSTYYNYYNGSIASLNIYNRALSANEVLHNYNALKGRFGL